MSRQIIELETILTAMITEHRKLLSFLEAQQQAMTACDLKAMDQTAVAAEACRLRVVGLEQRRRKAVALVAAELKIAGDVTIGRIAELCPQRAFSLLKLRAELKSLAEQVKSRSHIAGRVAGAVLGHLNTVLRLMSGAAGKAGLYNQRGTPRLNGRMGRIEAVG